MIPSYYIQGDDAAAGEPEKDELVEKAQGKSAPQCVLCVGNDSAVVVQCCDCSKPFCGSHGKVCQSCQLMLQRQHIIYCDIVQYPKISQTKILAMSANALYSKLNSRSVSSGLFYWLVIWDLLSDRCTRQPHQTDNPSFS